MYSRVTQFHAYIFFSFFILSIIGYWRILDILPCAIQQVVIDYFVCICLVYIVNPTLLTYPSQTLHFFKLQAPQIELSRPWGVEQSSAEDSSEGLRYFCLAHFPKISTEFCRQPGHVQNQQSWAMYPAGLWGLRPSLWFNRGELGVLTVLGHPGPSTFLSFSFSSQTWIHSSTWNYSSKNHHLVNKCGA